MPLAGRDPRDRKRHLHAAVLVVMFAGAEEQERYQVPGRVNGGGRRGKTTGERCQPLPGRTFCLVQTWANPEDAVLGEMRQSQRRTARDSTRSAARKADRRGRGGDALEPVSNRSHVGRPGPEEPWRGMGVLSPRRDATDLHVHKGSGGRCVYFTTITKKGKGNNFFKNWKQAKHPATGEFFTRTERKESGVALLLSYANWASP